MANIRKIEGKTGVSYKITVTTGRDVSGKQIRHYKTWVPDKSMTVRQMEKEARRVAVEFEREIETGFQADDKQTLAQYAKYFLEVKEQEGVSRSTIGLYKKMLATKILPAIGHIRLVDLKPQHLTDFYRKLREPEARTKGKYFTVKPTFTDMFNSLKIQKKQFAALCGLSVSTMSTLLNVEGKHINQETAGKIAMQLQVSVGDIFYENGAELKLSARYIKDIHRCVSVILSQAEKEMILKFNPAKRATVPGVERYTPNYFQPEQIEQILKALESEEIKWRTMIHLFIVSGCRRGEIAALKWSKIDFDENRICIDCSINEDKVTQAVYEGPTKTRNTRYVNFPAETAALLKKYRVWQLEQRFKYGSLWENTDYVFTSKTGGMLRPHNINVWLSHFSERHGFPHINPHAFRHSAASIMIANGVDVVTVSKMLGHAKTSMTIDTYSHIIEESKRKATECIADVILRKKSG